MRFVSSGSHAVLPLLTALAAACLFLQLCVSGCAVGPTYRRPVTTLQKFHNAVAVGAHQTKAPAPALETWWDGFNDPMLSGKAAGSGQGTFPESISEAGAITGRYVDSNNVSHGFLRNPAGDQFITFDAPGAGKTAGQGTFPDSINRAGAITGHYIDSSNVIHGFLRSPSGDRFVKFDAPGAGRTAGSEQGTFPKRVNEAGAITGHYADANNIDHGFLRVPSAP